jgi:release factor glutamine methyltransferase
MTINEVLQTIAAELEAAGYVHSQREAEILLGHFADLDTAKLYSHGNQEANAGLVAKAQAALSERLKGRPLAYIVGNQPFLGFQLSVDERALIPRPETEQLVELVVKEIRERNLPQPKILEVGTGSGAIAIALKKYFPASKVTATDISAEALELAEDNARALQAQIDFMASDILQAVPPEPYDLVVANLPYVPSERLSFVSEEILDWEPNVAIEAAGDGFGYIGRLLDEVGPYLAPEALLALEMWHTHAPLVQEKVDEVMPPATVEIHQDLAGFERFALIKR